ncbi:MAG: hypothetical protein ACRDBQ_19050 [Shewanella sp.]
MGIKLNWKLVPGQTLDSIEIYRGDKPIDRGNPGTPLATVAGNATEYEDMTVKNKHMYYYCIAGVKGNERAWGENQQAGYFSETGPGNHAPIRGNWLSGFMDTLSGSQFITGVSLGEKIPKLVGLNGLSTLNKWYKVVHNGKILFVSSNFMYSTPSWTYDNGLMYGTKGFGKQWPHGYDGAVDQLTTVEIDGLTYIVRIARLDADSNLGYLADKGVSGIAGSEWQECIGRLYQRSLGDDPVYGKPRFHDEATRYDIFGPGCWGSGKHRLAQSGPYGVRYLEWTGVGYWTMVLELIQP